MTTAPPRSPFLRRAGARLALTLGALTLGACAPPSAESAAPPTTPPPLTAPQTPAPRRDAQSELPPMRVSALPREGQEVLRQIARGGPFRYEKDGSTFGNRERLLPAQERGYYREYTVPTPGERDRGARRLVCGGWPVTSTSECYYTADHYASFRRVLP